ncbi:MAG: mucoidy inhibitor MuiA family protein [Steroidobacteraceae bacterium]
MRWSRGGIWMLAAVAAAAGAKVAAADVVASLPIMRVTVYSRGAVVTRSGTVALPAGTQRIVVHGLPADIDTNLLQVTVASPAARLGSVDTAVINQVEYAAARERELRERLESKGDQRAAIQDEIDTAQLQLKLLDSLAARPTGGADSTTAVTGANLGAVVGTLGSSAAAARARMREAAGRQRAIDREIDKLKADLAKVASERKSSTDVTAIVDMEAAASVPLTIAYRVQGAGWGWVYQARLDTGTRRMELARQGKVLQSSGEDWNDVALTLTTADPQDDAATPVVQSEFLDLQAPQPVRMRAAAGGGVAASGDDAFESVIVTAQRVAKVAATQYLVEYQVPGRTTLLADAQARLYPIASDAFDTQLVARVVPAQSRSAHLEATFLYGRDTPIEAGELQLYRDGAFVGRAPTAAFLPGAEVRMPFGADERIKVAVREEAARSDEGNLFGRQVTRESRQRFDITSYHAETIPVEVVDRIPVSRNDDVKVEVLKGATEPSVRQLDGKAGVLLWKVSAEPRKLVSIRHYYAVRYPRDRVLESTESEEEEE